MNELTRDELQTIIYFLRNRIWNIVTTNISADCFELRELVRKLDEEDFLGILYD